MGRNSYRLPQRELGAAHVLSWLWSHHQSLRWLICLRDRLATEIDTEIAKKATSVRGRVVGPGTFVALPEIDRFDSQGFSTGL